MQIELCVEAWEQTPQVHAEELAQRMLRHFPNAVVDRERGDAYVQAGLERLVNLGAPEVIVESHKSYFGNVIVIFVSVAFSQWAGSTAFSYLHTIQPPLGDIVVFEVEGAEGTGLLAAIANELATALGLVRCDKTPD